MIERVHRYREKPPLFELHGVDREIQSTLDRRVETRVAARARRLQEQGAQVQAILTHGALHFVTPLGLEPMVASLHVRSFLVSHFSPVSIVPFPHAAPPSSGGVDVVSSLQAANIEPAMKRPIKGCFQEIVRMISHPPGRCAPEAMGLK